MQVKDILGRKGHKVTAVRPETPLAQVAQRLAVERIGTVLVMEQSGDLVGIVSERDLVRHLAAQGDQLFRLSAREIMTRSVVTCDPQFGLAEVLDLMGAHGVRHLPVLEDGRVIGMISVRDLMDHRIDMLQSTVNRLETAQRQLRDAQEVALLAERAQTDFLANMSHQLKTPLNAIIGFSDLLRAAPLGPLGAPQYGEYASEINDAGVHLLEVLSDILDISRIQAGDMAPNAVTIDLARVIGSCTRLLAERAERAGVTLAVAADAALPTLYADPRMFKQMLMNLLTNAVKFTPEGGRIDVRAAFGDDGGLTVAVADTGIGIAAEDLGRVQHPFIQADTSLARSSDGTGLGLPLVNAMMALHQGDFTLASEPSAGTTATLRFPRARVVTAGSGIAPWRPAGDSRAVA
jgi:signal transduction histidine kinase